MLVFLATPHQGFIPSEAFPLPLRRGLGWNSNAGWYAAISGAGGIRLRWLNSLVNAYDSFYEPSRTTLCAVLGVLRMWRRLGNILSWTDGSCTMREKPRDILQLEKGKCMYKKTLRRKVASLRGGTARSRSRALGRLPLEVVLALGRRARSLLALPVVHVRAKVVELRLGEAHRQRCAGLVFDVLQARA